MKYFCVVENGYIFSVGTGSFVRGEEITADRYEEIQAVISHKPARTEMTDYRLKTDLTWEAYELPPMPDPQEDDLNADELLSILLGGDGV